MRVALIADVHANAPALQAVLADADQQGVEGIWFLGDVLGYGPLPVSCINLLDRCRPPVWLMGNHDLAGIQIWRAGQEQPEGIGRLIQVPSDEWRIVLWHVDQLRVGLADARLQALAAAPAWAVASPGVYAAHGAVRSLDPCHARNVSSDGNSYIQPCSPALGESLDNLAEMAQPRSEELPWLIVHGHTHRSTVCRVGWERPRQPIWQEGPDLPVNSDAVALHRLDGRTAFLCPGSAGYPRSLRGDPRAAYAVLDLDDRRVWFRRVEYDVCEAWAAMLKPPRDFDGISDQWAEVVQARARCTNCNEDGSS